MRTARPPRALAVCSLASRRRGGPAADATRREDDFTAVWTRAQALKVAADPTNTKPRIPADFPIMSNEVWVWDTWPLTNLNMRPITLQGLERDLLAGRAAQRAVRRPPLVRADRLLLLPRRQAAGSTAATCSRGDVAFGSREWAGSAVLIGDQVNVFYTASGGDGTPPGENDEPAAAARARLRPDPRRRRRRLVRRLPQPEDHRRARRAAATRRSSSPSAGPIIYAFRDPFVFRNPADGQVYLLFEGNTRRRGRHAHLRPARARAGPARPRGAAGLALLHRQHRARARRRRRTCADWRAAAAAAVGQLRQPADRAAAPGRSRTGGTTCSRSATSSRSRPGLTGPDGLYGFVGRRRCAATTSR